MWTSRIPWIQCFGTRRYEKEKEKENCPYTSVATTTLLNWFFAQPSPSNSPYLRSSSGHVRRTGLENLWLFRTYRETCRSERFRDHGDANRIVENEQIASDWWKLAARLRAKIRKSFRSSSIDLTVLQCAYHEDRGEGTVCHDPRRCGTGQIGRLMSRVYLLRDDTSSKVKRWIRGNTKIGPVLGVAISHLQGRYGIEIMIESLFGGGTCSWVMIVNGVNKYVTEMSEETQENRTDDLGDCTGRPVAKARPKQTPRLTSSSPTITLPYHQRQWIDLEPCKFNKKLN